MKPLLFILILFIVRIESVPVSQLVHNPLFWKSHEKAVSFHKDYIKINLDIFSVCDLISKYQDKLDVYVVKNLHQFCKEKQEKYIIKTIGSICESNSIKNNKQNQISSHLDHHSLYKRDAPLGYFTAGLTVVSAVCLGFVAPILAPIALGISALMAGTMSMHMLDQQEESINGIINITDNLINDVSGIANQLEQLRKSQIYGHELLYSIIQFERAVATFKESYIVDKTVSRQFLDTFNISHGFNQEQNPKLIYCELVRMQRNQGYNLNR